MRLFLLRISTAILLAIFTIALFTPSLAQEGKITFANVPMTSATLPKKSFKTNEFIYGRMELPSAVGTYFKMPKTTSNPDYPALVLLYKMTVEKNGENSGSSNAWPYTKISAQQKNSAFFNFDVLPEPSHATTMTCGLADYTSNVSSSPLYMMFDRNHFPENGKYHINIEIKYWTFDPYNPNNPLGEQEWTTVKGDFELDFTTSDLPTLQSNAAQAGKLVQENARIQTMEAIGLPKEWNMVSAKITSPFTEAQLVSMFLATQPASAKNLKLVVYPVNAPGWIIEKNELDLPLFKWHNQNLGFFVQNNARCYYISGGLRQPYEGGGKYGAPYYQWAESLEMNCKFIPKTGNN
ncbi:MAG: hypothetical protein DI538_07705 [Azospira oryzae]|jgi:hypothetical protein|nr:MAG: hypothetical protein DI538_07705 [Azospira oryzae]